MKVFISDSFLSSLQLDKMCVEMVMVGLVSPYLGDQSVWQIINDQERLELERGHTGQVPVSLYPDSQICRPATVHSVHCPHIIIQ